jgi:hypothetical protein
MSLIPFQAIEVGLDDLSAGCHPVRGQLPPPRLGGDVGRILSTPALGQLSAAHVHLSTGNATGGRAGISLCAPTDATPEVGRLVRSQITVASYSAGMANVPKSSLPCAVAMSTKPSVSDGIRHHALAGGDDLDQITQVAASTR